MSINVNSIASFAFKNHCSYFGGRSISSVISPYQGELVFLFKNNFFGNLFFQWIRWNFDSDLYQEKELIYKGNSYISIFLKVPQRVNKKFLFNFRKFSKLHPHLIGYFNQ